MTQLLVTTEMDSTFRADIEALTSAQSTEVGPLAEFRQHFVDSDATPAQFILGLYINDPNRDEDTITALHQREQRRDAIRSGGLYLAGAPV